MSDYDKWSNELRYVGSFDRWSITAGVCYSESTTKYTEGRVFYTLAPFAMNMWGGGKQNAKTYTSFGEAEYEITDTLRASAGLNVARDEKDVQVAAIAPTPDNQPCDVRNGTCNYGFSDDLNNTCYSPKVSLTYNWPDQTMVYGHWSVGIYGKNLTDERCIMAASMTSRRCQDRPVTTSATLSTPR